MALEQKEAPPSIRSDSRAFPESKIERGVFVLALYRDGHLTAAVHTTEDGAKEAAADLLDDEKNDDEEGSTLEVRFAHAQRLISDEGGIMEIIHSPVFSG
jgi:hypothetical protein